MGKTTAEDLTLLGEIKGFIALEKTGKKASNGSIIWKCQCTTCGNIIEVAAGKFKRGEFAACRSCADKAIIDLEIVNGQKILRLDETNSGLGRGKYYLCKCEICGFEHSERLDGIKSGTIGCRRCADRKNGEIATVDITGKLYGRLRVVCQDIEKTRETGRVYWKCQCNCGNSRLKSVRADSLRSGKILSCGCLATEKRIETSRNIPRFEDLSMRKFGHLTALEPTWEYDRTYMIWKCQCDCDNKTIVSVSSRNLKRAKNINCGCIDDNELVGMQFDYLKVIRKANHKVGRQSAWDCECKCGGFIAAVPRNTLVSGGRKSCGCLRTNFKDLTGERFGHLIVIREIQRFRGDTSCAWLCKCDCGNECEKVGGDLDEHSSCGCVGKSEWHIKWQGLFGPIRETVIGNHRPDYVKGDVAFEFQHSRITAEEIRNRNKNYLANEYRVVWIKDGTVRKDLLVLDENYKSDGFTSERYRCPDSFVYGYKDVEYDGINTFLYIHVNGKLIRVDAIEPADSKIKGGDSFIYSSQYKNFDFEPKSANQFAESFFVTC